MEINKFIANFAEQFDDVNAEELTVDTNFRDIEEWSSIAALSIIAMVDEEYEVMLKGDDIRNATTIGDLFNLVQRLSK